MQTYTAYKKVTCVVIKILAGYGLMLDGFMPGAAVSVTNSRFKCVLQCPDELSGKCIRSSYILVKHKVNPIEIPEKKVFLAHDKTTKALPS